ncbi:hypothetical protein [Dictyobacter arantiisoli]|uniref:Uncharacterized protein n=1 Tax=Dictyobacter arantiisoli TaxID=2014874 RepID=A0A5A5TJ03_9CHLR|nr:hypothetical protein [Dictyobacter arantiisoli]GCF10924.1 hypothetical protein KDI_44880 [Dictyobacter arantiisoli]
MDSDDEKLTIENVDEQIEHYLSQPQADISATATTIFHTVHNLQSIYAENRRLEQVWARINNQVSALNAGNISSNVEVSTIQSAQEEKQVRPTSGEVFSHPVLHRAGKRSQRPFIWNWRMPGFSLAAAVILLVIFFGPLVSYALYGTSVGIIQSLTPRNTPQSQPTMDIASMKKYSNQYFTIQYPSNWVITQVTTAGSYQQTVQFRPSVTSTVFINIDVLLDNKYSTDQLLHMDPDVKLGTLISTSAVTYHDIPWTVGIVELTGSAHTRAGKLEVAYSHQRIPYKIELGTTADKFDAYTPVFNTILASFHTQTTPVVTSVATPTVMPAVRPTATPIDKATPSPTIMASPTTSISDIKVYSSQYFTIQYPSNWVITQVTTAGIYQQTVQFRPSVTSAVFINVDVMYPNDLSNDLLLLMDPDVKRGTQLSTSSATYHGIPWKIGIVNLLDSVQGQSSKVEVAYSNQNTPYKIELSAPPDMFNSYTQKFNTMLASFYSVS